ncbi:hypothetical protein ACFQI7_09440 [Paenibacillus allorhizosphaerae]|nr:hypothetical protein [Paenibacillus allorhizosphaerae]
MKTYAHAVELQAQGRLLEAEDAFVRVQSMRAIDYKERETAAALSALRPVTDMHRTEARLSADIEAARNVSDVPTLATAAEQWSQMKQTVAAQDEKTRSSFAQIEAEYGLEQRLSDAFAQVKKNLTAGLESWSANKNAGDGERLLAFLAQIPAAYYPDEKTKHAELNRLALKYGQARLNGALKGTALTEALSESDKLLQLYTGYRLDGSWIAGKVEPFIQNVLSSQLDKNDVKGFLGNVRLLQEHPAVVKPGSKTDAYVRSSVQKLLARARQLADSRKFQDAVDLYTLLGSYQNTDKEIQETEQRWMETEPARLLGKAAGEDRDFSYMVHVKGKWGAKAVAAGLAENKTLILARLMQDGTVSKTEIGVGKGVTVTSIQLTDSISSGASPMLLLEAASKSRKARYILYEAEPQELRMLLDIEADGYTAIRKGAVQFDSPAGEGPGSKALYEYRDGGLRKVQQTQQPQQQTAYKLVTVSDLPDVKAENVRFECDIVTVDGSNALGESDNRYVHLVGSGKTNWKRGSALITGMYAGTEEMKIGSQTVNVYRVQVLEANYP